MQEGHPLWDGHAGEGVGLFEGAYKDADFATG